MLRLLPGISSMLISTFPVHSPAFFRNLSRAFPVFSVANIGSFVGPQNKIGHPAHCDRQVRQVSLYSALEVQTNYETRVVVSRGLRFEIVVWPELWFEKKETCVRMT